MGGRERGKARTIFFINSILVELKFIAMTQTLTDRHSHHHRHTNKLTALTLAERITVLRQPFSLSYALAALFLDSRFLGVTWVVWTRVP